MNIKKYLFDAKYRFIANSYAGLHRFMKDEKFIKKMFNYRMGYEPNLDNPKTFNEKLQWIKLHDHNPAYPVMADKSTAKDYVADQIGRQYIIPTIGVWDKFNDMDFSVLPGSFVLKCTHDSGGIYICKNKSEFNREKAEKKITRCLKHNYYYVGREWPYKDIKPRIIAEEYIKELEEDQVIDYKVHCFNGEPKIILVCRDRFSKTGLKEDWYDADWNLLGVSRPAHKNSGVCMDMPDKLDEMLSLARKLSSGIPFIRTDFYIIGNKILFGELTFFPANGFSPFLPDSFDRKMGDMLVLPGVDN